MITRTPGFIKRKKRNLNTQIKSIEALKQTKAAQFPVYAQKLDSKLSELNQELIETENLLKSIGGG